MIHFRYEAKTHFGVPIYGTEYADHEPHLREILAARNLILVQCGQLTVDPALATGSKAIPRAIELRVGERLREAVLSGIPAHEAVRAMACEPFDHPLVSMMPSILATSLLLTFPSLIWGLIYPPSFVPILLVCGIVFALVSFCWIIGWLMFIVRPRQMLLRLARQLEQGQLNLLEGEIGFRPEINAVLRSGISNDNKAKAVADLLPALQSGRFVHNQLFLSLAGLYLLVSAFVLGGYWVFASIIPKYRDIYEGFAISLPVITSGLLRISRLFEMVGTPGLLVLLLIDGAGLICLWLIFGTQFASDHLATVPIIGRNASMLMQARVARVIAALLRYDCDRPEVVRAATSVSASRVLRAEGKFVAAGLERAGLVPGQLHAMSALPLSLLMTQSSGDTDRAVHSSRVAKNFSSIAEMLEKACQGRSLFLITMFQTVLTIVMAVTVGFTIIALFLPLIKLLNDLA